MRGGIYWLCAVVMSVSGVAEAVSTVPRKQATTAPFDLAQNFVRQIGSFERDRARAEKDQAANKNDFASCVRNLTTFQMDLDVSARYLMSVKLPDANMAKAIPPMFGTVVSQKLAIIGDIMKECEAFITPDPKIDYTVLAQRAPKLTAMSDYIDKTMLDSSPAMFATLISSRNDSKNRANHLVISRAQRAELLKTLSYEFGDKLDQKEKNSSTYVIIAQIFRDKLNEFKCSDDPWE